MTVWIMSSPSAISTLEKKRPPVSCSPGERWLWPENLLEFAIRTSQAVPARVTDRTDHNSNRTGCNVINGARPAEIEPATACFWGRLSRVVAIQWRVNRILRAPVRINEQCLSGSGRRDSNPRQPAWKTCCRRSGSFRQSSGKFLLGRLSLVLSGSRCPISLSWAPSADLSFACVLENLPRG